MLDVLVGWFGGAVVGSIGVVGLSGFLLGYRFGLKRCLVKYPVG